VHVPPRRGRGWISVVTSTLQRRGIEAAGRRSTPLVDDWTLSALPTIYHVVSAFNRGASITRNRPFQDSRGDPARAREVTEDYEVSCPDPCTDRTVECFAPSTSVMRASSCSLLAALRTARRDDRRHDLRTGQAVVISTATARPARLIPEMVRLWRAGTKVVIRSAPRAKARR